MNEKAEKLAKYKQGDSLTVLLIENSDIAPMNRATMIMAVEAIFRANPPSAIDRVWYADTSVRASHQFWNLTPSSRAKMPLMNAIKELDNPPE